MVLAVLTILLGVLNLYMGAVTIAPSMTTDVLLGRADSGDITRFLIIEGRLPQMLTALLAGAALAVTGLLLQTSFRNPLAGPSILGISQGASLGVAVVMLFFGGSIAVGSLSLGGSAAVVLGALAGSLAVMVILIMLSVRIRSHLLLLITGMMMGYLTSSVVTLLSSLSSAQGVQGYVMWGMGTFSGVSLGRMPFFAIVVCVGLLLSMTLAKPLNILMLGNDYALNLGVNIRRVRNWLLLIVGIVVAIVTAYCGPISFIGMAIPHLARFVFKTDDHFVLMPGAMLCGAIVALACNLLSTLPQDNIIPLNALTPIFGVPVILYVILKRR